MNVKRIVSWSVAAVVAVALCVWIASSWHRWFGNVPEEPYSVPCVPDRITLTYGPDAATSRTVSWRCDTTERPAALFLTCLDDSSSVLLPAAAMRAKSRKGSQYYYRAELTDLRPGGSYAYQVFMDGQPASPAYGFNIQDLSDGFSFLLWGDIQDAVDGDSPDVLHAAAERFPDADFWAFVGDMIERPTDTYWNVFYQSVDSVAQQVPLIPCTGNHDYLKGVYKRIDTRWACQFGLPANGPQSVSRRTYYVDFPTVRFIVIDTDALQLPHQYITARRWLRNTLRSSSKRWNIVLMHHPVYSASIGRDNLLMRLCFRSVVEDGKADLVLAGHDHSYMRREANATPLYMVCTTAAKDYLSKCQGAKVCCGHRLYQQVSVSDTVLSLSSYLAENGQTYDSVAVHKAADGRTWVEDCGQQIEELIDLPKRYAGKDSKKVGKFLRAREERMKREL